MTPSRAIITFSAIYFAVMEPATSENQECTKQLSGEKCCTILSSIPPMAYDLLFSKDVKSPAILKCAEDRDSPKDLIHECTAECSFQNIGLLKPDKTINDDMIFMMTKQFFGRDKYWKDIAITTVKQCLISAPKEVSSRSVCKSGVYEFLLCIKRDMFLNCPADLWSDSEKCNEDRNYVEQCGEVEPVFNFKKN